MSKQNDAKKHIHKRLRIQLGMFALVAIVMIGIVIFDIFTNSLSLFLAILGIAIGLIVGFIVGKMYIIKWHEETEKVIISMDKTSIFIIILYIAFRVFEKQLFSPYINSAMLGAFTFSILAGIMFGRFLSMGKRTKKVLKEQQKI
jgi:hypothetical protein